MTVATPTLTLYPDGNQTGSSYPGFIDADNLVNTRAGWAFAPHARGTPTMQIEVDPGFVFSPGTQTLTQIGAIVMGNLHSSTIVDGMASTASIASGMAVRSSVPADGIPLNDTVNGASGSASVTLQTAATTSNSSVPLVFSQVTAAITAPVSNPRIDRVVVDASTGLVSVVTGTENASPVPPAIPAGKLPVAQILLQTGTAAITNSMITDERAVWGSSLGSGGIPWANAGGSANALTASYAPPNTALTDKLTLGVVANTANTSTTPTFAPDGLAAQTITKQGGQPLLPGDIPRGTACLILQYNLANTRWELLNPPAPIGTSGATLGLLNSNKTDSGNNTFSGNNSFTGSNCFTGSNTFVTQPSGDNSTEAATTAFVKNQGYGTGLKTKIIAVTRTGNAGGGNVSYTGAGFRPSALAASGGSFIATNVFVLSDSTGATTEPGVMVAMSFDDGLGNQSDQTATLVSYDADGFTLAWTYLPIAGTNTQSQTSYVLCLG